MNTTFALSIALTIGVSALCSVLEAMILSTTVLEIEALKKTHKKAGRMLERFKNEIEETSSAILILNTVANTLGATVVGGFALKVFTAHDPDDVIKYTAIFMCLAVLIFSEIIPKNIGVLYRTSFQRILVYPLWLIRILMMPVSKLCKITIQLIVPVRGEENDSDEEILMLAEKSAKDGNLTTDERDIITNALTLDDLLVKDIMTPRTVVTALEDTETVDEVFRHFKNIPFARMPVYQDNIDNITGVVRRRELLSAVARDEDSKTVAELQQKVIFVPENGKALDALKLFLKKHQQLAVVVDEFGSTAGVVSMEDVIEHILGKEIFENDDVAVDMREFAKKKFQAKNEPGASHEKVISF